jgi:hypothetical protein
MFTLRQTDTGWEVVDGDGNVLAAFDGKADDDQAQRRAYGLAIAWLADSAIAAPTPPATDPGVDPTAPVEPPPGVLAERWQAGPNGIVLATATDDGRDFTGCQFTWRPAAAPLPVMFLDETTMMGHFEAKLAGFIDQQGDPTTAAGCSGYFFDSDVGRAARDSVRAAGSWFCSVDPGMVTATFTCLEEDADEWGTYCVKPMLQFEAYEIAGVTLVPFPAFAMAVIELAPDAAVPATEPVPSPVAPIEGETVAASAEPEPAAVIDMRDRRPTVRAAAAIRPPAEWFTMDEPPDDDPRYVEQLPDYPGTFGVPLHITDDGHVYGHAGLWGTCHVGYLGECVTPPQSQAAYAHYHVGLVVAADGTEFPTGTLVAGCDHASTRLRAAAATDYYAHNGVAWGDVRARNGRHGVWVSGTLRPDVTEEQVRVLRAGSLSGDWRAAGRGLEMIGVLAVNVPGFPIVREALAASGLPMMGQARLESYVANGRQISLVAARRVFPADDSLGALVAAGTIELCQNCGQATTRPRPTGSTPDRTLAEVLARLTAIENAVGLVLTRTRPLLAQAAQAERARLAAVREA